MTTAPPVVLFTRDIAQLPERIRAVITAANTGTFVAALKTAHKPNATVPLIWLVVTSGALLLCNTHSKRGLWANYSRSRLPFLRIGVTLGGKRHVELEDGSTGTQTFALPPALTSDDLAEFIAEFKRIGGR